MNYHKSCEQVTTAKELLGWDLVERGIKSLRSFVVGESQDVCVEVNRSEAVLFCSGFRDCGEEVEPYADEVVDSGP